MRYGLLSRKFGNLERHAIQTPRESGSPWTPSAQYACDLDKHVNNLSFSWTQPVCLDLKGRYLDVRENYGHDMECA